MNGIKQGDTIPYWVCYGTCTQADSPQASQPVPMHLPTLWTLVFYLSLRGSRKGRGLAFRKLVCAFPPCCQLNMSSWFLDLGGAAFSLLCWVPSTYLQTMSEITWSLFPFPFYCAFSNEHPCFLISGSIGGGCWKAHSIRRPFIEWWAGWAPLSAGMGKVVLIVELVFLTVAGPPY